MINFQTKKQKQKTKKKTAFDQFVGKPEWRTIYFLLSKSNTRSFECSFLLKQVIPATRRPVDPSTRRPVNPSTGDPSIRRPVNPAIRQTVNLPTHQPVNTSTRQPGDTSILWLVSLLPGPATRLAGYPSTRRATHQSFGLSIPYPATRRPGNPLLNNWPGDPLK